MVFTNQDIITCDILPSAKQKALSKEDGVGYRYPRAPLCRVPNFAECLALGKVSECLILPSARHSAKPYLSSAKFRRVPDIWHSAKI